MARQKLIQTLKHCSHKSNLYSNIKQNQNWAKNELKEGPKFFWILGKKLQLQQYSWVSGGTIWLVKGYRDMEFDVVLVGSSRYNLVMILQYDKKMKYDFHFDPWNVLQLQLFSQNSKKFGTLL